jgi:hypothetical protein
MTFSFYKNVEICFASIKLYFVSHKKHENIKTQKKIYYTKLPDDGILHILCKKPCKIQSVWQERSLNMAENE